jgi:uncharacterized protein with von Willebrand factor type A (vWA) domain
VVYLLDRGTGTSETFDAIKAATVRSLRSLPPAWKFQIIFWDTDDELQIPRSGLSDSTKENIAAATEALADVFAWGQSKIEQPLRKALLANPAQIVLVTGKGGLDETFVKQVLDLRQHTQVRIHALSMGSAGSSAALKKIAEATGGEYREVATQQLIE